MNPEYHDLIRTIAAALYRSTGAVAFPLIAKDVRSVAEAEGHAGPLADDECLKILDSMADGADFNPLIEMAISCHLDMQAEAHKSAVGLVRDIRLTLSEIEGALSITEGGRS